MARPGRKALARAALDVHGRTHAEEIGFDPSRDKPSEWFQLLCASLLFSARISAEIAVSAAQALRRQGWTTAGKLADSTWAERAKVLNEAGYARYDERTSSMLGDSAQLALDRYGGDLRKLREEAGRDPSRERRLLKEFKGIGDVGVDIFFREAQGTWDELHPFLDKRARAGAAALGLDEDAKALARLVDAADFPRFVAALVRVERADDAEKVRRVAAGEPAEGSGDGAGGAASKSQLYERAQRLGVSGRSRMSKQELAAAVERAEKGS